MSIVYIIPSPDSGLPSFYAELITFGAGSAPPRPTPVPPSPGVPTHPIALPGDPWWGSDLKPTHPIFLPGMPGWPETPPPGTTVEPVPAMVFPMPEGTPPATPPSGMPADSVQVMIYFGKGTKPAVAWVQPYASTGPIAPPA